MKRVTDRRKNQERDGIQNKNCAEGNRHLLFIGLNNRADGSDGAAAANRGARRNQERRIAADLQKLADRRAHQERKSDSESGINKSAAAGFQNFVEIHSEAESDDGYLQKHARGGAAGLREGMRSEERRVGKECRSRWSP